jgi:hypothetical protein
MNAIFDHVLKIGVFQPGQYAGSYAGIPFTHEEWIDCVYSFWESHRDDAIDVGNQEIRIWVKPFMVEGRKFVFRCLEMGEIADQLWTEDSYRNAFSSEARKVFSEMELLNDHCNQPGG